MKGLLRLPLLDDVEDDAEASGGGRGGGRERGRFVDIVDATVTTAAERTTLFFPLFDETAATMRV